MDNKQFIQDLEIILGSLATLKESYNNRPYDKAFTNHNIDGVACQVINLFKKYDVNYYNKLVKSLQ